MVFERIEILQQESQIKAKCPTCNNHVWKDYALEITPVIAGGLIVAWKLAFGVECTQCETYVLDAIGMFDHDVNILSEFKINLPNLRKLRKLHLTDQIKEKYQKLREVSL